MSTGGATMTAPGTTTARTLPALRHLGELADRAPVIVIDSREQSPLVFRHLKAVRGTLLSADYSFCGGERLFGVERKTIPDLVACCCGANRERFERELHRLRGFRFKRLVVIGSRVEVAAGHYRGRVYPKAVLSTLAAFEVRFDVPVVWAATAEQAARMIEGWAWFFARELLMDCNQLWRSGRNASKEGAAT